MGAINIADETCKSYWVQMMWLVTAKHNIRIAP
jgi:hypothetical protein